MSKNKAVETEEKGEVRYQKVEEKTANPLKKVNI